MFTNAKRELKELIDLVRDIERYDATLAANSSIVPQEPAVSERKRKERRMIDLMCKYELN